MAFRVEITQVGKFPASWSFDETPRFWYPHVPLDAWIDFSYRTVELRPSECREKSPFSLISPSFFLSLYVFFLSPFLDFSSPFFLNFRFVPSGETSSPPSYLPLVFLTFFFLNFLYLLFLFSFIFIYLFFSFGSYPTEPLCCSTPISFKLSFFVFFFIIPFDFLSFISLFDTWLNMSHLSKCYVSLVILHDHHAMCPSPKVPSGSHMVIPCVTRHLAPRKM